ncbi:Zinc finger MYM-type protein 1 [Glycine max]|nr:Zinc finger MYM-type protein 1 [Glycine max]
MNLATGWSIAEKDAAFCLCCYLFRHDFGKQSSGDTFVIKGFTNWNKKERLASHVGGPNIAHNIAWRKCQDLMNQNQHIKVAISKQSEQVCDLYRRRLTASIDCIHFLLKQGLAFRGHDESTNSANQGNFLELLKYLAEHNESINHIVLENAPENHQLIAPKIQKDIVNVVALETTNAIITDLGDELFAIIVDEAHDISNKEQMAIALRYVNKKGSIVEHFFGMVYVKDTTVLSLKMEIDELFCKHGLSISRIHGQGYDGASNMQGEFCGLKNLILKENSYAFYVHCFAHQLKLTLVAIAKNHIQVSSLFNLVSTLLNVVGGSCKRHGMLHERQINYVREALGKGEIPSGQGLNQETSLKRVFDTRWGSHYATLINLILMYSSIIDALEIIKEDGSNADQRAEANGLLHLLEDFDFAFTLHLMENVLGISNELSQALQRKDQDIINVMNLVNITKL